MKKVPALLALQVLFTSLLFAPAQANDLAIWDSLQGSAPKGYVLLLRHSLAPGVGDPANFTLGDCSTQRNLSDVGRQDAKDVGQWLKRREIKIFQVQSSRWCRALETARLLNVGKVKPNRNLDSLFQESNLENHPQTIKIKEQIVNHRRKTGLLIMVGHYVNIAAITGVGVNSGEGILVKADSRGKIRVYGATPALGR